MEEVVDGTIHINWTNNHETMEHHEITEQVIELSDGAEEVEEEEYLVGEEIIPSNDVNTLTNSLDHIAAENLIYMAHDGQLQNMGDLIEEQVEQVENADYNEQQYYECQVTEEVITDDWVQPEGEERVEIPVDQLCTNEQMIEEDMDVPLPTDEDEYTTSRPYPCDFCSRRFRKKASLMNHMVAHQNDRPHVCNLCGARYIRRCDLLNHLKIHAFVPEDADLHDNNDYAKETIRKGKRKYDSPPPKRSKNVNKNKNSKTSRKIKLESSDDSPKFEYMSEADMRILSNKERIEHFEMPEKYPVTDPKKPFVCQHCGVGFARQKALESHARVHGGDSPFECDSCGEMFWDPLALRDHQKYHHQGEGAESEYEPENEVGVEDTDSENDSKFGEFYCEVCGITFHRYDLLKRHSRQHIKKEYSDSETQGLSCNVCGDTFAEALDLLAHAEVHARFQPLKCMLCGETFIEESDIKSHLVMVHNHELTQNSCRICGKLCRDGKTLMKHSWDHSRVKNHSCSKCGKNFHNKARLKRHMMSHRNKSVICDECGEEFPDGRTLMNHRHSHSNGSGRQFPCRECGKTFGSRSSQQIHIRIHTGERPYGCKYCWKAFADGGTLRKHERIHTGEKPYVCSVCPRAFNQRVVLREHIRTHHSSPDTRRGSVDKPYHCQVCEDLFETSVELVKHLIHHSDMNTVSKRLPLLGPRKYQRRRKLKPHELERLRAQKSKNTDNESDADDSYHQDDDYQDDENMRYQNKSTKSRGSTFQHHQQQEQPVVVKKESANTKKKNNSNVDLDYMFNSLTTPIESYHIQSTSTTSKPAAKSNAKKKKGDANQPSRPKMIHTQKTRVPIEDGKRKTKTLITRTTPPSTSDTKSLAERSRPRTKNVNYHVLVHDKLPNATFPNDVDLNEILNIKQENVTKSDRYENDNLDVGYSFELPRNSLNKYNSDIVNDLEEILRSPIKATSSSISNNDISGISEDDNNGQSDSYSRRPRRNVKRKFSFKISPPTKSEKLLNTNKRTSPSKGNNNNKNSDKDINYRNIYIKEENEMIISDEVFKCEMCSAVFTDRAQLLIHVPIHI